MNHKLNTILIINKEPYLGDTITMTLEDEGFQCLQVNNTDEAYSFILKYKPMMILLDWVQSGAPSIDFIHRLKQNRLTCNTPILMLTSKNQASQNLIGLEAGADDYMTKPLSHRELIARLKAILRRSKPQFSL